MWHQVNYSLYHNVVGKKNGSAKDTYFKKNRNFQCVKISAFGEISISVVRNFRYMLLFVNALCAY